MLCPLPPIGQQEVGLITDITPDYFRAVRMPILIGRAFSAGDNETSQRVAIVNRAFAKRFFFRRRSGQAI